MPMRYQNLQRTPAKYQRRSSIAQTFVHVVSMEPVTAKQIAERLGVSVSTARARVAKHAGKGPMTWESLK